MHEYVRRNLSQLKGKSTQKSVSVVSKSPVVGGGGFPPQSSRVDYPAEQNLFLICVKVHFLHEKYITILRHLRPKKPLGLSYLCLSPFRAEETFKCTTDKVSNHQ